MPSKLRKAIEAVKDQTSISIAKVSNNHYTSLEVAVLKATTHDDIPIDERYVYEVVHLVSADQIYAAACARAIGKRISRTRNWIVALKSLMLVFRIFQHGDPYFPREVLHAMKKGAKILNLSTFRDDSNSSPWDFTAFVRTFALYLDERLDFFLTGKLQHRYTSIDRRREGKGGQMTNDSISDMKPSVLLHRIAFWQRLLERTIATRPTGAARTNRLVQISLYAVVQESFHLYKDISEGLTFLVDSFFHLRYEDCVNAFQTCLKATSQFAVLSEFYYLCKSIGVGKDSQYPSVETLSKERIETLREFLNDQSSFPSVSRSPNRLALPSPPNSKSTLTGSKRTSLEDLVIATKNGTSQGRSIDLEAYPDQFKQQSDRDETFRISNSGSTRSLSVTNTMADLISLEDWSGQGHETETKKNIKQEKPQQTNAPTSWELVLAEAIQLSSTQSEPNEPHTSNAYLEQNPNTFSAFPEKEQIPTFNAIPEQEHKEQHTKSGEGWELVLAETATEPTQLSFDLNHLCKKHVPSVSNTFKAFPKQVEEGKEASSRQIWELVLFETAKQPRQQTPFSLKNLYHQPTALPTFSLHSFNNQPAQLPPQHYNPFLEDSNESAILPAVTSSTTAGFETSFRVEKFSSAPAFQRTPAFYAHNSDNRIGASSAPAFQASPTFSAHNPDNKILPAPTFQVNPTFSSHNLDNGTRSLSALPFEKTPPFSVHYPDNGTEVLSAPTFQATPNFSAHNPNNDPDIGTTAYGNDPFGAFTFSAHNPGNGPGVVKNNPSVTLAGAQMFEGSSNQQKWLHQQRTRSQQIIEHSL